MNEGAGLEQGQGVGEVPGMDARNAMIIVQETQERARRELRVRRPVLFLIWGLVVLVGYGAMWLSVRGQHRAPDPQLTPRALLCLLHDDHRVPGVQARYLADALALFQACSLAHGALLNFAPQT